MRAKLAGRDLCLALGPNSLGPFTNSCQKRWAHPGNIPCGTFGADNGAAPDFPKYDGATLPLFFRHYNSVNPLMGDLSVRSRQPRSAVDPGTNAPVWD